MINAFILAAGFGTRLRPFTDHHPKALAPVLGKPLLEHAIRHLQELGVKKIVVNVHHFAQQIIDFLQEQHHFGSQILISDEREEILETGGGLKKAAPLLMDADDVLMVNVDIIAHYDFKAFLEQHQSTGALATLAVQKRKSSRGLLFDEQKLLKAWRNRQTGEIKPEGLRYKPSWESFAFSGIQLLKRDFLTQLNRSGRYSIIDVYLDWCAERRIMGWDHTGDLWMDCGKPEALKQAEELLKNKEI